MANVALVEKTSSRTDYIRHFENKFEFDRQGAGKCRLLFRN